MDALAGRPAASGVPPLAGSSEELATLSGELLRGRFAQSLREVRAAPDPELTRARILASASAGRPTPQDSRRRALITAGAAGAGLAAGIAGTLLLHPARVRAGFADVQGSQEIVRPTQTRATSGTRSRHYVVRSADVATTAAELAALLAQTGASFRVTQSAGAMQFDLQPLAVVPPVLAQQGASRLKIDVPPDTAIRIYIADNASP
jgi:hypothetical protein